MFRIEVMLNMGFFFPAIPTAVPVIGQGLFLCFLTFPADLLCSFVI